MSPVSSESNGFTRVIFLLPQENVGAVLTWCCWKGKLHLLTHVIMRRSASTLSILFFKLNNLAPLGGPSAIRS